MSYFDHVGCHSCGAQFDPNRVEVVNGRMACPYCKAELGVTDLFGIKASFLEDDQPLRSMEDLVPGAGGHFEDPWGQPSGGHDMNRGAWAPDMGDAQGIHTGRDDGGYTHQRQAGPQAPPRQAAPQAPPRQAAPQAAPQAPPRQKATTAGFREGLAEPPAAHRAGAGPLPESRRIGSGGSAPMPPASGGNALTTRGGPPSGGSPASGGGSTGSSALDALKAMKGKKK